MRHALLALFAGAALLVALPSLAQDKKKNAKKTEPCIRLALPLGVAPGQAAKLTLRGLALESAKDIRLVGGTGSVKIVGKSKSAPPEKLPPEKFGDSHVEIALTVKERPPNGAVTLVVVTPQGETKPHSVLVEAAVPEKEPNDGFRQAQAISLPALLEGRIERPRDVDVFTFRGRAGQKIVAEVRAARHGSALDAMLYIHGAGERQIASAGATASNPDPRLEVTLPTDGMYTLTLIDAHDSGGALHVYRLMVR